MSTDELEYLAFLIKEAKELNQPRPIVFLGAGASKSGGIPLAGEIITDIESKFKTNPKVRQYFDKNSEEPKYSELLNCLTPHQRNQLLKEYIDEAKINVTHIYLAQMMVEGYIDYVLTVNFDNLMLRALALYNEFPPTYDMAILKDLTTTTLKEKSVVYLHGQHHGLWLLNTDEELTKATHEIQSIANSLQDRTWIVIGYSGDDPVFETITKPKRFDKGFYWIAYKDVEPNEKVLALINEENKNASLIKGFDSDTFMLKLSNALGLPQPEVVEKPFSSLQRSLENIVDIEDGEHFKEVRERLEISKKQVEMAIKQYELGENISDIQQNENEIDLLKKQIIDVIANEKYDQNIITKLEAKANVLNDIQINQMLARLYFNWGYKLSDLYIAKKNDEFLLLEGIEKYQKSIQFDQTNADAFINLGNRLSDLAKAKNNDIELFNECFDKYKYATELNPKDDTVFNNWGIILYDLAKVKNNDEALLLQSIEKHKNAIELNPTSIVAYNNLGNRLSDLAKVKNNDATLFQESIEKYKRAIELDSKYGIAYHNLGSRLSDLAKIKNNDAALFQESIEKFMQAFLLGESPYNLACAYALTKDKPNALKFLELCLVNKKINVEYVYSDEDWKEYLTDSDFNALIDKYRK